MLDLDAKLFAAAAVRFAATLDAGQVRRFTGKPYVCHCRAVGRLVYQHEQNITAAVAGVLHDVLEDTNAKYEDVHAVFGPQVAKLVVELTKDPVPARELDRLRSVSAVAQTIKCADIFDNVQGLDNAPPSVAVSYLPQKSAQALALDKANPTLRTKARVACARLWERIGGDGAVI
jgi:(p)ppGpp synthase/HD superfamily hydrolase